MTDAIREIAAGRQPVVSREIRKLLRQDPPAPELSSRQQEILAALTRDLTNEDIAKQLDIGLQAPTAEDGLELPPGLRHLPFKAHPFEPTASATDILVSHSNVPVIAIAVGSEASRPYWPPAAADHAVSVGDVLT